MSIKLDRINNMLLEQISVILSQEVKDQDIKFVTITACKTTGDLSFVKVYFTTLNDREATLRALKSASGFIRRELAERVELRHIPELNFVYDESIEYGNKIEQIIKEINE